MGAFTLKVSAKLVFHLNRLRLDGHVEMWLYKKGCSLEARNMTEEPWEFYVSNILPFGVAVLPPGTGETIGIWRSATEKDEVESVIYRLLSLIFTERSSTL